MVSMPAYRPVTTPVLLTEAIEVFVTLQVPPVTASLSFVIAPKHTEDAPEMAAGAKGTVIILVTGVPQPVVYIIVAVPTVTAVTIPITSTVATDVWLLLHVPPPTASLNAIVDAIQREEGPDMAAGTAMTVIVLVASVPQPVV